MNKSAFILTGEDYAKEIPNYYYYANVVHKIKSLIHERVGCSLKMYLDEDKREEVWDVLLEDVSNQSSEVEFLGNIYDCVETDVIYGVHRGVSLKFKIKPNIENSIFYYANYEVALVRVNIYYQQDLIVHDFIFATSDEQLLKFFDYVLNKQRMYLLDYVTVFTDIEHNDFERTKEHITSLVSRDDVLMESKIKTEIYRSIDQFFSESKDFYKSYSIPYRRGILLYGKPGNGKTTLVKSIAGSITAPVVYWQITEHTSSYSVSEIFKAATDLAPLVLVIEDIDSMPESVRSVFLNTLDGALSKEGIFLIGTTNYPEKIDSALINRAGRFDRAYEIKLPTADLRLKYLLKKGFQRLFDEQELTSIANDTEGFSFAQLNELYSSAALQWYYENKVDINSIIKDLALDNTKGRKNNWILDSERSAVGFKR